MKVEAPFFVPIISDDCEFFQDIKKDLIEIIMDIHNDSPYKVQGNFPNSKNLKYNLTESDSNFLKINEAIDNPNTLSPKNSNLSNS